MANFFISNPVASWMFLALLLAFLEVSAPGIFLIFFSFGALVTGAASLLLDISFGVQIAIFVASSLIALFCLRNYLKSKLYGTKEKSSEDMDNEYIGHKAVVEKDIVPNIGGKIIFKGASWMAESNEPIAAGEQVVIVGQRSITLIVRKIDIN